MSVLEIIEQEKIRQAVRRINPNAVFDFEYIENMLTIKWPVGTDPIPRKIIEDKLAEIKKEYDNLEYSRQRRGEYPDWREQLNKIYDDGIEAWKKEMIDPIKAKYPKPE